MSKSPSINDSPKLEKVGVEGPEVETDKETVPQYKEEYKAISYFSLYRYEVLILNIKWGLEN